MTLGLAVWEADVMGRTRTIILDLRWRLIPALHWPLIEKVCQLLVYLIASILFKPLYFEVSLLQQLSLYLEYLPLWPHHVPCSPLLFSSQTQQFSFAPSQSHDPSCHRAFACAVSPAWNVFLPLCLVNSSSSLSQLRGSNPSSQTLTVPYSSLHNAVQVAILQ